MCDLGYIRNPNGDQKLASLCVVLFNYLIFINRHLNVILAHKINSFQMF